MKSSTAVSAATDRRTGEGPREAREDQFSALLEANRAALTRLAASYARSSGDRDDLLQEIAMAVWQALPRFRGECTPRTFLFRIAHNRCLAHVARRRPLVPLDDEAIEPGDPRPSAEAAMARAQEGERLLRAIRRLPLTYRHALVLMLEGLDYREIAQVLGISPTNVGARLTRARQILRRILEEQPS